MLQSSDIEMKSHTGDGECLSMHKENYVFEHGALICLSGNGGFETFFICCCDCRYQTDSLYMIEGENWESQSCLREQGFLRE